MKVQNFIYNGFGVSPKPGLAKYTAEFKEYASNDVGIAICTCSDGKERRIPTCMLVGFKLSDHPEPKTPANVKAMVKAYGGHIGTPSAS